MFGLGSFGAANSGNIVTLSDAVGVDSFQVKDADGVTIFDVFSNGNVGIRGELLRQNRP